MAPGEKRVAATPDSVKKILALGCEVSIEKGAGLQAGFVDQEYEAAGANVVALSDLKEWRKAEILLSVQTPLKSSLLNLSSDALVVGLLSPYSNSELSEVIPSRKLSAIALELLPRISRAQAADALSSQANIAGYKSVLLGAAALDRYFPMLMTAAGTVQPAKVIVLGAGVAGLQAVATARRLGAVVYVSDIRSAVKEQVESLGARFIEPPSIEEKPLESGGYAKQASESFLIAQRQKLSDHLSESDVAICTAQVPGRNAPLLIDESMLDRMRPGAVVVDLAVSQGGNCAGAKYGETVERKGVKLIGASDLPSTVPNHASSLYARNLVSLLGFLIKDRQINLNLEDELIKGCLVAKSGQILFEDLINSGGFN